MATPATIVYCNCTYAQVLPPEVKSAVLKRLCDSGIAFEAVADLCELSARKDPALRRLADCAELRIAACFPRAIKWLFDAGEAPLHHERTEVLNMRTQTAEEITASLFDRSLTANLPQGRQTRPAVEELPAVPVRMTA